MPLLGRVFNAITNVHPMHSMVVHFPIALTAAALLFLILALWRRNEALEHGAFVLLGLAALGAVVAAITGYRDNLVRFDGGAPLIPVKIFLGVSLILLASLAVISRWRQPEIVWRPGTTVLYVSAFLGCVILSLTLAFIGGVILYGV